MVELLSPIAPSDAPAAASSIVELLSPIAPSDAPAAASYRFTAAFLTGHAALTFRSIGDNRSTIPDAPAAAFYRFKAAFLTGHATLKLRSIGDNRSTIETKQTRSCIDPADRLS
jgi:hypothetical protein